MQDLKELIYRSRSIKAPVRRQSMEEKTYRPEAYNRSKGYTAGRLILYYKLPA